MEDTRQRRNKVIMRDAILIGGGILYYIFVRTTGLAVPCVFRKITGFLCPGCGITRAAVSLCRFNFSEAFSYNQYVFIVAPIILYLIVKTDYRYVHGRSTRLSGLENIIVWVCIAAAVLFAVWRNVA